MSNWLVLVKNGEQSFFYCSKKRVSSPGTPFLRKESFFSSQKEKLLDNGTKSFIFITTLMDQQQFRIDIIHLQKL